MGRKKWSIHPMGSEIERSMSALDWLVSRRFESLVKRDCDWVFQFDKHVTVVVRCLWRLLENGRIRVTGEDHGHIFGLPAPVDCEALVNERLSGAVIHAVELREGTLDFRLQFDSGAVIEFLPNSAGYEAWQVSRAGQQLIAVGGGELVIYGDREPGGEGPSLMNSPGPGRPDSLVPGE
jgi:hypothetical protein